MKIIKRKGYKFIALFIAMILGVNSQKYGEGFPRHVDLPIGSRDPSAATDQDICVTWGGAEDDWGRKIVVDSSGNIYVIGSTRSFGEGSWDALLVKFDSTGVQLWNRTWGNVSTDQGRAIALDALENVIIMGLYICPTTGLQTFLAKYDSDGVLLWNKTWGEEISHSAWALALDDDDNLFITGSVKDGDFDNAILVKFSTTGEYLWNSTWGLMQQVNAYGITIDTEKNLYITGRIRYSGTGLEDAFVVKYNSFGTKLWNRTWGGSFDEFGCEIVGAGIDAVYITGFTDSFGAGLEDVFVAKYTSQGEQLWNTTWGGSDSEWGEGLRVDSDGNVVIVGWTESYGSVGADIFLLKYNEVGVLQMEVIWGDDLDVAAFDLFLDADDNIFITGDKKTEHLDLLLLKNPRASAVPERESQLDPRYEILPYIVGAIGIMAGLSIGFIRWKKKRLAPTA